MADDRLRLIFTCCHPALPIEAQVVLTLRTRRGHPPGRILARLMPDEPEALGLLALLLLHDARRASRVDAAGDLVPLEAQDRSQWDRAAMAEGLALLDGTLRRGLPGPYQVQAAIAACHARAEVASASDWREIGPLARGSS